MLYANEQDVVCCHAKFLSSKSDCQYKARLCIVAYKQKDKQETKKQTTFTKRSFASKQTSKQNHTPLYNKVRVAITIPTQKQVRPQRES